jgi:23S rRNA (cytidine2498-2'-O)-methyltransferase
MKGLVVSFQPGVETLVEREVRRADPHATLAETLEPGLWRVACAKDDPQGTRLRGAMLREPPIAIRHMHPIGVDATVETLEALVAAINPIGQGLARGLTCAVQTRLVGRSTLKGEPRAFDVNDAVLADLGPRFADLGIAHDRRRPEQVVSVTIAGSRVLAGLSPTRENLSAWPGGMARIAGGDDALSRAKKKLLEALEVFGLSLPRAGRALDLGAAPGGWTQVLLEQGLSVMAVDPASLDHRLQSTALEHFRGTAERFLATSPRGAFSVIVNDMRLDARDAARLLLAVDALLAPGGLIVTTLKLPERGFAAVLDQALAILREHYRVEARQLFHNRSEITAVLRPRLD